MKKLTPILVVKEIEPCLEFWQKLGFEKTVEVPEGGKLGFVILQNGDIEVMYQSLKSLAKDLPVVEKLGLSNSLLYIETNSISEIQKKVKPEEVVVQPRKTFYGANEIFVREPAGNIVGFAERG